ncbi:unnamed protein product, partial [Ectocarpus sp. 8 AP-2014]
PSSPRRFARILRRGRSSSPYRVAHERRRKTPASVPLLLFPHKSHQPLRVPGLLGIFGNPIAVSVFVFLVALVALVALPYHCCGMHGISGTDCSAAASTTLCGMPELSS